MPIMKNKVMLLLALMFTGTLLAMTFSQKASAAVTSHWGHKDYFFRADGSIGNEVSYSIRVEVRGIDYNSVDAVVSVQMTGTTFINRVCITDLALKWMPTLSNAVTNNAQICATPGDQYKIKDTDPNVAYHSGTDLYGAATRVTIDTNFPDAPDRTYYLTSNPTLATFNYVP